MRLILASLALLACGVAAAQGYPMQQLASWGTKIRNAGIMPYHSRADGVARL